MRAVHTWTFISDALAEGRRVMLLFVLHSQGSSPGRQGFFMAVDDRGAMEGSIGGGIMEHKFVELAKQKLASGVQTQERPRKQIHDKKAAHDQSGMICSGEQTVLLLPLTAEQLPTIDTIINSLQQASAGELRLGPSGLSFTEGPGPSQTVYTYESDEQWEYIERTGYRHHVHIIGGGHCSLALSSLMRSLDFYVTVYDDRPGLKTLDENKFAHKTILVDNYGNLRPYFTDAHDDYVVIMSFGYRTDDLAMRSLYGLPFRYIGLLGSANKVKTMMSEYEKEGMDTGWLKMVHAPIGLQIKSQTPEEIAVSISAQIIAVKNSS